MYFRSRKQQNNVSKDLFAGAVGGLAASWIMPQFQIRLAHALGHSNPHEGQEEDATVKTAQKISLAALGHQLSPAQKKTAGPVVHYAYGTGIGAVYGGLAHKYKAAKSGFGSAFGAGVWAAGEEIAVPLLGIGKKPTEIPVSQQFQSLAAHLVYGVTLEAVRRLALKVI